MQDHYLPYLQELIEQDRDLMLKDDLRFRNLVFDRLAPHAPTQDVRLLAQVAASGYVRQRGLDIGDEEALSRRCQDQLLAAGFMPTDIEEALNLWRQALPPVKKAPEPVPQPARGRKVRKASAESDLLQMVILPKVHSGNFSEESELEIYAAARVKGISDERTRALINEHAPELARLSAERLLDDELEEELPNRKLLWIFGITALVLCIGSFIIVSTVLKPNVQEKPTDEASSLIFGSDEPEITPEPTESPSEEPSPEVSAEVTASATPEPIVTAIPTVEPTPLPTAEPTAFPTAEPTRATPIPTPIPTNAPTTEPSLPVDQMMTPPPEALDPTPLPLPTEGT